MRLLCGGFLLLLIGLTLGCQQEPVFNGKTKSQWKRDLTHRDKMARWRAAATMAIMGAKAKDAIPELTECLHDTEYTVRFEAATALAKMGPEAKSAVPDLIALLKDEYPDVRNAAAAALKKLDFDAATAAGVE